jgi:hypothetical protein
MRLHLSRSTQDPTHASRPRMQEPALPGLLGPSFYTLPPELRLEIYSYMAIPFEVSFWSWQGLYFSCKEIHDEMDTECGRLLKGHLQPIVVACPADSGIPLEKGVSFSQMPILEMAFWHFSTQARLQAQKNTPMDFSPLFGLHLDSITFRVKFLPNCPKSLIMKTEFQLFVDAFTSPLLLISWLDLFLWNDPRSLNSTMLNTRRIIYTYNEWASHQNTGDLSPRARFGDWYNRISSRTSRGYKVIWEKRIGGGEKPSTGFRLN